MRKHLGTTIRAARIKRSGFLLGSLAYLAEHFAASSLVIARCGAGIADCLQQNQRPKCVCFHGVDRLVEADSNVRLSAEVIDLIRLNLRDGGTKAGAIHQVAIMENKPHGCFMWVVVQMV